MTSETKFTLIYEAEYAHVYRCNNCKAEVKQTLTSADALSEHVCATLANQVASEPKGEAECPLTVVENVEGTFDILVDDALTHPRMTQWNKAGAEEIVRLIHKAYTRARPVDEVDRKREVEEMTEDLTKRLEEIKSAVKRQHIDVKEMLELASTPAERSYEKTIDDLCGYVEFLLDLVESIRAEALEEAARECERLVTFTEDHDQKDDNGCTWCKALEDAAAKIRALITEHQESRV